MHIIYNSTLSRTLQLSATEYYYYAKPAHEAYPGCEFKFIFVNRNTTGSVFKVKDPVAVPLCSGDVIVSSVLTASLGISAPHAVTSGFVFLSTKDFL